MYSWLVGKMIRRAAERMRAGDFRPTLNTWADELEFRFPGRHSWAAHLRTKQELERWYERFVRVGIQLYPDEVFVKGPPWNTRVCVRFHDFAKSPTGETVYENHGVLYGRMAWGKVRFGEAFLDTQRVAEFDEYLAATEKTGSSGSS
jgi:ketosteroid isomerase-like protein